MNWTLAAAVVAVVISAITLIRSIMDGGQTSAASMATLKGRVDALEVRQATMDSDLAEVKKAVAKLPVIETKLDGLDRLVSSRMDNQDKALGRIEDSLTRSNAH